MKKFFISILFLSLALIIGVVFYLSFYGYETNRFNKIIKTEIKKSERDIDLNFQKVSVLLQLKKLTLYIKFINPEIQYKFTKIPLDKLRANINLASLLKNEISIKKIDIETKYIDFNTLKPLVLEIDTGELNKNYLNKIKKSKIKIKSSLAFDDNYELNDNFNLNGNVKDTLLVFSESQKISKLNFNFSYNNKKLKLDNISSKYKDITIKKGEIDFKKIKNPINFKISAKISLNNNNKKLPLINKSFNKGDELSLKGEFLLNKNNILSIKNLIFKNEDNLFEIEDLLLDKNYNLSKFKSIKIKTKEKQKINNDFLIKYMKDSILINGKIFDAKTLLKDIGDTDNKNNFFKKISNNIEVEFNKVLTDTKFPINKFRMVGLINKGKLEKISSKSEFGNDKFLDIAIKKEKKTGARVVEIYSDIAKPLVNSYEFFKGLDEGNLLYVSRSANETSSSVLKIKNFKLNNAPGLAKLLSLADLKGLTDALKGEGISFDSLIIKYESTPNWMEIKEIFLIGPSISVLVEGYFDKEKDILSLRGTLVPAKTLNQMVSKIPVVGDILIGKKVGEGVFGVSFKIKGPTNNLKTTVNPVKTITPRFITRALEELKKKQSK